MLLEIKFTDKKVHGWLGASEAGHLVEICVIDSSLVCICNITDVVALTGWTDENARTDEHSHSGVLPSNSRCLSCV